MKLHSYQEALTFLNTHVPTDPKIIFSGNLGLKRSIHFFSLFNSPQNKIKTIHIAGTSGKGSTSYLTSILLRGLGFKTGLFLSPHLLDVRERIQINGRPISKEEFLEQLNFLLPYIDAMKKTTYKVCTWFEIMTAIAFHYYYEKGVDYAVIETGLGGLFDSTNSINGDKKMVILTKFGLDHTQILGNTIQKIAQQKAEIIKENNSVVSAWQKKSARKVIDTIAKKRNASVFYIKKHVNFKNIRASQNNTTFDYQSKNLDLQDISVSLVGEYQAENTSLALTVVALLSKRDTFSFDEHKVRQALMHAFFPARFDTKTVHGKRVISDGAHSPQKMRNFIATLKKVYPGKKFDFLIAFKKDKDYPKMLEYIAPLAHRITISSFQKDDQDLKPISENPQAIGKTLEKLHFHTYTIDTNSATALKTSLSSSKSTLVITGSLYFLANIYKRL